VEELKRKNDLLDKGEAVPLKEDQSYDNSNAINISKKRNAKQS
jgi:hypothetical protein